MIISSGHGLVSYWWWITMATSTTRTPAFWGYIPPPPPPPPLPNDYPYHWVILDPKSNEDKVRVTNFKNSPKFQIFWILKPALHATHLLKLLDKMCKYEMDPMSIIEDTERTRFCPQTDRWTDGQGDTSIPPFQPQTDRRTRWYQYTPLSTSLKRGGIIIMMYYLDCVPFRWVSARKT